MDAEKKNMLALALSLASKVEIGGVRLLASNVKSNLDENPGSLQVGFAFGTETKVNRENNGILVHAHLKVEATSNGDTPDNVRLHIAAKFALNYTASSLDGVSDESLDAFGKVNGIHNVWPYWREYVQSTVGRLGLPPLILPILTGNKIVEIYEQQNNADVEAKTSP